LAKQTTFPTTSLLDGVTLGKERDCEKKLESYLNRTRSTRSECSSCGASIPANRTKCRFCLSNHLDGTSDDSRAPETEWTLLHVVHLVVEASTFYAAVAKGAAAARLLTKADRDPTVDGCQLIYDLDTKPAAQLTDKWPSLPEAVRVTSESGEQLLTAARERTGQIESTQSRREGAYTTFLYEEEGTAFVMKIVFQTYWRTLRTTSGWCQRLHSSVPTTTSTRESPTQRPLENTS